MSPEIPLPAIGSALPPVLRTAVENGSADVTPYPVPGLPENAVWRVALPNLDHPQQTYVGVPPMGIGTLLPDDQPAFFALVSAHGGARIGDPDTALGYVLAFLEVTRGPTVLVRPIANVTEIRWRGGTAAEEARRVDFLADARVVPPTVEAEGTGFAISIWLIVDQRIQLNTFRVTAEGAVDADFRVVASDLPLPIAR